MRRGVSHTRHYSSFFHNIATFLIISLLISHLLYSKRQVILVTCIFMYKGWKPSWRFCLSSLHPHLRIIVTWESLIKQPTPCTLSSFLPFNTFTLAPLNFLSYSGQPPFLFKRYICRNISLRSGSRTTLYLLQWRWLPRRVTVIEGRRGCAASKKINRLSSLRIREIFSSLVRKQFSLRTIRSGTLTLTYCWPR